MTAAFFQPLALYSQPVGLLKKVVALLNHISILLNFIFYADLYNEIYTSLIIIQHLTYDKKYAMETNNVPAIDLTVNQ